MTDNARRVRIWRQIRNVVMLLLLPVTAITMSGEIKNYVIDGIRLCAMCVIPSTFPFMILSEYYVEYVNPEDIKPLAYIYKKIFGLSPITLRAFICGNVCGFPIGARLCCKAYSNGLISREEAAKAIAYSSNVSIPFIIGAVAEGMMGDVNKGYILLICIYSACIICGLIYSKSPTNYTISEHKVRQSINFVQVVKRAGISCVELSGFIILFSAVCGTISKHINFEPLSILLCSAIEITSGLKYITSLQNYPSLITDFLIGFCSSFGGLCVLMQNKYFTNEVGLSIKNYLIIKLSQGLICGSLYSVVNLIIY